MKPVPDPKELYLDLLLVRLLDVVYSICRIRLDRVEGFKLSSQPTTCEVAGLLTTFRFDEPAERAPRPFFLQFNPLRARVPFHH